MFLACLPERGLTKHSAWSGCGLLRLHLDASCFVTPLSALQNAGFVWLPEHSKANHTFPFLESNAINISRTRTVQLGVLGELGEMIHYPALCYSPLSKLIPTSARQCGGLWRAAMRSDWQCCWLLFCSWICFSCEHSVDFLCYLNKRETLLAPFHRCCESVEPRWSSKCTWFS